MAITAVPNIQPASSSRPIEWRSTYTATDPDSVKLAEVTVFLDAVNLGTLIIYPYDSVSGGGGTTDYLFKVDVSNLVDQNLGANTTSIAPSVIGVAGTTGIGLNTEFYGNVNISISYRILDASTGLLGAAEGTESSPADVLVYKCARQHTDSMDLQEFITALPQEGRPLSDRPLAQNICEDQNAFLSYISNWNYMLVVPKDANGSIIGTYFVALAGTANVQYTVGVGAANITQYIYIDGSFAPAIFPAIADVYSYEISLGYGVNSGGLLLYTQVTDTYTYTIIKSCCDKRQVRLQWINTLGGSEAYNFTGLKELELTAKAESGQKSLNWAASLPPHSTQDYGKYKHSIEAYETINMQTEPLPPAFAAWLKGVLYSPLVVIEQDGQYISCIVEDARQVVDQSRGLIRYVLEVRFANNIIVPNL